MLRLIGCVLISILTLAASEVAGKWNGSVQVKTADGDVMTVPLRVELQQSGEDISGTIGRRPEEHQAIQKGKVQGSKVTFEVSTADSGEPFKFELTLAEASLAGEMRGHADNGAVVGKVALTKGE